MRWAPGFDPNLFCLRIEQHREQLKKKPAGALWSIYDGASLLVSGIELNEKVKIFTEEIAKEAFASVYDKPFTVEELKGEVAKVEQKYLRKKEKNFVLITDISINNLEDDINKVVDGVHISIINSLPSKLAHGRREFIEKNYLDTTHKKTPINYKKVIVKVPARTAKEAGKIALQKINYLRAIWLYFYNFKKIRVNTSEYDILSSLVLGCYHSIHNPETGSAEDDYFYEIICNKITPINLKNKDRLYSFEKLIRNKMRSKPFKDYNLLTECLIDYAKALEEKDVNSAILILWSILERITNTDINGYKQLRQKISNMYLDYSNHLMMIDHIHKFRNKFVHQNYTRNDASIIMMQLKNYVEELLYQAIFLSPKIKSLEDFNNFLKLPVELESLNYKRELLSVKKKMIEKTMKRGES